MAGSAGKVLFSDKVQHIRYGCALLMVVCMVGMSALAIGMWIVDKRAWAIYKLHLVSLMALGAVCGAMIIRYSWFSLPVNLMWAFAGAAVFISAAMILFLQCYKWPTAQLIICLVPGRFRKREKIK